MEKKQKLVLCYVSFFSCASSECPEVHPRTGAFHPPTPTNANARLGREPPSPVHRTSRRDESGRLARRSVRGLLTWPYRGGEKRRGRRRKKERKGGAGERKKTYVMSRHQGGPASRGTMACGFYTHCVCVLVCCTKAGWGRAELSR